MALGTTADYARALEERGADLEALARKAVRIAAHRGYVTAGLANGSSIIAAKYLGYIRKDKRRKGDAHYLLTKKGRAIQQENPTPAELILTRHVYDAINQYRGWVSVRDLYHSLDLSNVKIRKAVRTLETEEELETKGAKGDEMVRVSNPAVVGVDGTSRTFRVPRKKRAQIRANHRSENPGPTTASLVCTLRF